MKEDVVYFRDGKLIAESGKVRAFELKNQVFLENGQNNLIFSDDKKGDLIWQIDKKPFGDCLILGLRLGIAPGYIFSLDKINNVTVVEEDQDIINVHNKLNKKFEYKIIKSDYLDFLYTSTKTFNFIFIDCYDKIDHKTLPYIADIVTASKKVLKPKGVLIGWLDENTPEVLINSFYSLFSFLP